jgi:hypothetical protein
MCLAHSDPFAPRFITRRVPRVKTGEKVLRELNLGALRTRMSGFDGRRQCQIFLTIDETVPRAVASVLGSKLVIYEANRRDKNGTNGNNGRHGKAN